MLKFRILEPLEHLKSIYLSTEWPETENALILLTQVDMENFALKGSCNEMKDNT